MGKRVRVDDLADVGVATMQPSAIRALSVEKLCSLQLRDLRERVRLLEGAQALLRLQARFSLEELANVIGELERDVQIQQLMLDSAVVHGHRENGQNGEKNGHKNGD